MGFARGPVEMTGMAATVVLLTSTDRPSPDGSPDLSATLSGQLGTEVALVERVLGDALPAAEPAELVWLDTVDPEDVAAARSAYPQAGLLVTLGRGSRPDDVVRAFALGADLVQRDEGPALVVASLAALARRTRRPQVRAG